MQVALTGATGFIGKRVVAALRRSAHDVRILDRSATGDIGGTVDWGRHLAGTQIVVHLAALAHARGVEDDRLRAVNVDASVAIGRAAASSGTRMLFLSTAKVLGEETGAQAFNDASPLGPVDSYARAKAAAEQELRGLAGLRLCVLRPPLVYGPGVGANFLALLRAVAGGWPLPLASVRNARSLISADNLSDAVIRCVESPGADGRSFLLSDGPPVSTPELCRSIGRALAREARLVPFPPAILEIAPAAKKLTRSLVVDDGGIRRALGWTPPRTFEEELRLTAEWYRAQRG